MEENYRVKTHLTNQVDRLVGNVEYKGYFHGQPKFSCRLKENGAWHMEWIYQDERYLDILEVCLFRRPLSLCAFSRTKAASPMPMAGI